MTAGIRTRYAPSPTGFMHIGNFRTALYEYLFAKRYGGTFILRIEDTDQERYVEGAVDVVYRTLKLAGIKHDEGPDIGGQFGPYVQSERKHLYMQYAKKLVETGAAYYCFCTKERHQSRKESQEHQESGDSRYDRHCLMLSDAEVEEKLASGAPFAIRQKMPDTGTTSFTDAVYGKITVENSLLDDQVLIKSDGMPTYNFANVVDDHLMEITHIVRGNEYLSSSPKYNLLYEAFGWEIPVYIHLPLITKEDGGKISKRYGDPSIEEMVEKGYLPEAIVNYVALLGWNPGTTREFFTLQELEQVFSVGGISRSPAIFDINKLNWMNGEYIRKMPPEEFHKLALPYYGKIPGSVGLPGNIDLARLSALLQIRTEVLGTIPQPIDFLAALPEYDPSLFVHAKMKTDIDIALRSLNEALDALGQINAGTRTDTVIHEALAGRIQAMQVKNSQMFWPLRTALSGKESTPGGATDLAYLLGQNESLRRIQIGIDKLSAAKRAASQERSDQS